MLKTYVIQCITASIGTLGFCMIFHTPPKQLTAPVIGGGICWAIYLLMMRFQLGIFLSTLIAAAFVGIYGEIMAFLEKVPSSLFFIPCCVPLIPGSNLYYAMTGLISNDWPLCRHQLSRLVLFATGIALGLGIVLEISHIFKSFKIQVLHKKHT